MSVALGLGFIKLTLSPLNHRQNLSSNPRSSHKLNFTPKSEFSPSSLLANSTSIKPFLGPLIYDSKLKSHFEKNINLVGEDWDGLENSSLSKNLDDSGFLNLHNISTGHFNSNNNFGRFTRCSISVTRMAKLVGVAMVAMDVSNPPRAFGTTCCIAHGGHCCKLIGLPTGLCTCGMANQTLIGGIVWNYIIAGKGIVPVTLFLVRFGEFVLYFAALYVLELLVKGTVSLVSELGSRLRLWWHNRLNR